MQDYLKIGKASQLSGHDRRIYRIFEMIPGILSWSTLIILLAFSYFKPIWVAFFLIAFDTYWLLLVIFLGIHLIASYQKMKKNLKIDWKQKCESLRSPVKKLDIELSDIYHLLVLPTCYESLELIRGCFEGLLKDGYDTKKMLVVLALEGRAGEDAIKRGEAIRLEYAHNFKEFMITVHPDGIVGEIKGKGSNQAWAAKEVKEKMIDANNYDYSKLLVSVFDIDTIVEPGYFHRLTYLFLTCDNPYHSSYQPIPVYHNNLWQAPFFSRVAAASNTFWQMMQQVRQEKLATYSSHSMTWKALVDIGFWSTNMVSEDSRIYWHCFCYYNGNYDVIPMHFPVSMDVCMDETAWQTAKSLYKQQRRWGWGVENLPYLLFNTMKRWKQIPKGKFISRILIQLYGFHSWATNALIIGFIGWMPLILGGDAFNSTVLSRNLPLVTRNLMTMAMVGLALSALISTLLLPKMPKKYGFGKRLAMVAQWAILPFSIIIFGSVPGIEAQTKLMLGKYLGFWVTPKSR